MSNVLGMGIAEEIQEIGTRWADAEQRADSAALDALTTDDFTLVGPVGFVLDKQQWLGRYRGGFAPEELTWDDVTVRGYGDAAVAVGRQTQKASFQGQRADGQFRTTHVFVRQDDRWLLAGQHLSPIGGPPPFARPQS
jgi:ketosteroid isomerase-like protein